MKIYKKIKEEKAAIILESTIVLPLVFVVLFAMIFMGFILHEQSTIDGAAKRGSIYAARLISDPQYSKVIAGAVSGASDPDAVDLFKAEYGFSSLAPIKPYRYFSNSKGEMESLVTAEVKRIIDKSNTGLHKIDIDNIDYFQENKVIYQKVAIEITSTYKLPNVFAAFNLPTEFELKTRSAMTVNDPDEFIRNADFAVDLVSEVIRLVGETDVGKSISEKLTKVIEFKDKLFK